MILLLWPENFRKRQLKNLHQQEQATQDNRENGDFDVDVQVEVSETDPWRARQKCSSDCRSDLFAPAISQWGMAYLAFAGLITMPLCPSKDPTVIYLQQRSPDYNKR